MQHFAPSIPLDDLDTVLLRYLHEDARLSAAELARRTGANERTIRLRIERFQQRGLVHFRAVIQPLALGYGVCLEMLLAMDPAHETSLTAGLLHMPELAALRRLPGGQFSARALFRDTSAMQAFLRRLETELPGITITERALVPSDLREPADWLPIEVWSGSSPAAAE